MAVASPAPKVTPVGAAPASIASPPVTSTDTSSSAAVNVVRVRVKTASAPSSIVSGPVAATVTTGFSSSRTVTEAADGVPSSQAGSDCNVSVTAASASSTPSSSVGSVTRAVSLPAPKVTLVGAVAVSTVSPPVTSKDTVSASGR